MRLKTMVVTCLWGAVVVARLANAAEWSLPRLDSTFRLAQTPVSPRTSETATTQGAASAEELAKKLSNPIASLISVPFQSNFDYNAGQDNDKFKYTLNITAGDSIVDQHRLEPDHAYHPAGDLPG
jgi:hypothetical protein